MSSAGGPRNLEIALELLNSIERPKHIPYVFQMLVKLERYKEVVDFINKWHEHSYADCFTGVSRIVTDFYSQLETVNTSQHKMQAFLKCLDGLHSDLMVNAILELFFQYPTDKSPLVQAVLSRVDAFLKEKSPISIDQLRLEVSSQTTTMTDDQLKATKLLAARYHYNGHNFTSGLIRIQIACRCQRNEEDIALSTRKKLLTETALSEFYYAGSNSGTKFVNRILDGLKLQEDLLDRIGHGSNLASERELRENVLNVRELLRIVSTHPRLKDEAQWREKLAEYVQLYDIE